LFCVDVSIQRENLLPGPVQGYRHPKAGADHRCGLRHQDSSTTVRRFRRPGLHRASRSRCRPSKPHQDPMSCAFVCAAQQRSGPPARRADPAHHRHAQLARMPGGCAGGSSAEKFSALLKSIAGSQVNNAWPGGTHHAY
jgi:hypothetical protein